MTEPTIDLDAILKPYIAQIALYGLGEVKPAVHPDDAKQAMLQACKECLRVASEQAEVERKIVDTGLNSYVPKEVVKKESILNVEKLIKL